NTIATYQDELSNPRFPTLAEYSRPWVSPFADKKQLTADERREILQLKGDREKVLQQLEQMGERVERRANVTRRRRPAADPLLEMDPSMVPGGQRGGRPVRPTQPTRATPQRDANAERLA